MAPANSQDSKLSTSLLSRLNKVERDLKQAQESIRRKDEEIKYLKQQLERGKGSSTSASESMNEMRAELAEMKAFLNEYGMVWIGGKVNQNNSTKTVDQGQGCRDTKELTLAKENIRIIEKNVKELNAMVGEEGTNQRLKETLVLYRDGMSFNKKPFRSYSDKSAQLVIRDLVDGYFPQELKHQYPEGVQIVFVSKVDQTYESSMKAAQKPKSKLPSNIRQLGNLGEESEPSTESFLGRVPKTVIQNGKIVQMRDEIDSLIHLEMEKPVERTAIHSLFTQKLNMAELRKLEELEESEEEDVLKAVLQIKREDGMQTYVLKLPYWATIGDLRSALDAHRQDKDGGHNYVLRSAFPPQTYSDEGQTLEEAGLVPNATLFMKQV